MNKIIITILVICVIMGIYWLYKMIQTKSIIDIFTFGFIGTSLFFIIGLSMAIVKEGQNG